MTPPGAARPATRASIHALRQWTGGAPSAWATAALLFALAGCAAPAAFAPAAPPLELPPSWSRPSTGPGGGSAPLSQWWLRFADAPLRDLVQQALEHNPDIAVARAAWHQAQARSDIDRSALAPTLGASVSAQRSFGADQSRSDALHMGLNAAINPDLFGALGLALSASQAAEQAAQLRLGAAQSEVAQAVALDYITLRSAQARLGIAQDHLASQLQTLQIVRWRNLAGLIGAVEVEQAVVAAGQTRAELAPLYLQRDSALHSMAVRVGQAPASLGRLLLPASAVPQAPLAPAPGTPGQALDLRPQVRAAQSDVAQALALADQARAAQRPSAQISAQLGLGAATLEGLSTPAAATAALALGLLAPLLDGGAGAARAALQDAALAQAQARYQGTALTALREVEDALLAQDADAQQWTLLGQLAVSADRAATLAQQRFASGLVDFQVVLETQRSLLSIQNSLALAWAAVSSDQVRLYGALGGSWSATATRPNPTPTPTPVPSPTPITSTPSSTPTTVATATANPAPRVRPRP